MGRPDALRNQNRCSGKHLNSIQLIPRPTSISVTATIHGLCIHACVWMRYTVLSTIGTLYIQMGEYEKAEVNLKHALLLNPEHYGAVNNLKVLDYHRARRES